MSFSLNIFVPEEEEDKKELTPIIEKHDAKISLDNKKEKKKLETKEVDISPENKQEIKSTITLDESKKHSRKNPEFRQQKQTPLPILKELRSAPTEELAGERSEHIFGEETTFESLGMISELANHVTKSVEEKGMGLAVPTKVQSLAIPSLLQGRDALIKAETGSGKTLCFVLPILNYLASKPNRIKREDGTYALILSPTRELCLQIHDVLNEASKPFHWIISTPIVGGEKKKSEKARLRKGINIVVATPGRFTDHLRTTSSLNSTLSNNGLNWLVLDEVDRLLDSGFEKQIQEIFTSLKDHNAVNAQTILLSATITPNVKKLAEEYLKDPIYVDDVSDKAKKNSNETALTSSSGGIIQISEKNELTTPKQLVQHYVLVDSSDRLVALASYLRRHVRRTGNTCKIIVFVSSRACAEFYTMLLSKVIWPPPTSNKKKSSTESTETTEGLGTKWFALHGSVDQKERKRTLKEFASCRGGILVCTDVAARGLDLPEIDLVVQFDPPAEVNEYVHRVGRTARSGRRGSAVIFLRQAEMEYLQVLKRSGIILKPVKMTYESLLPPPNEGEGKHKLTMTWEEAKTELQSIFEENVKQDEKLSDLARNAYLSWVGAYSVHSGESKQIFVTRELHFGQVAKSFALKDPPTKIKQHLDTKKRKSTNTVKSYASTQEKAEHKKELQDVRKKRLKVFDSKSEFEA